MTWDYRVIRVNDSIEGDIYQVHEVYYEEDQSIVFWTAHPACLEAGSVAGLKDELEAIQRAFELPVLQVERIGDNEQLVPVERGQ